jgi:two-component system, OmpR family, phosphate regulon sensor histidine kinase PhoR
MFERRSLRLPITLGVVMLVLLVALIVGWILLTLFGALQSEQTAGLYWALLSVGTTSLAFVLFGVVMYLTLSIKTINLTRRQSNFIDSVTHELKSPIASLKLYVQTLSRRQMSPDEQATFYGSMLEDVERLDSLINHLLDAARLEKHRTLAEKEDVELASLLRKCAADVCLRYQVPDDVVTLELQPCTVLAVRVDLELVFRNLIDNAVKYAGDEPRVEISLDASAKEHALVRVSDNGRGISVAQRRKIFGRFVRLGSELERDKPGTGLGLYIVRTLVHRLGGRIKVKDRDKGQGTTFEVELPGKIPDAASPGTDKQEAA